MATAPFDESRVNRGQPTNKGQFRDRDHPDAPEGVLAPVEHVLGVGSGSVFDSVPSRMRPGAFTLGQVGSTLDERFGARLAQHTMVSQFLRVIMNDPHESEAMARQAERGGPPRTPGRPPPPGPPPPPPPPPPPTTPMGSIQLVCGPVKSVEGRDGTRLRYISSEMFGPTWLGNADAMNDGFQVVTVSRDATITDAKAQKYQEALRCRVADYPLDFPTLEPATGDLDETLPDGLVGHSAYAVTVFDRGGRAHAEVFIPERLVIQRGDEYYEGTAYGNGTAVTKTYRPEYLQGYAGHIPQFDPERSHIERWVEAAEQGDDTAIWAAAGGNPPTEWEPEARAS